MEPDPTVSLSTVPAEHPSTGKRDLVDPRIASLNSLADVLRQAGPLYSECKLILKDLECCEGGVRVERSDSHGPEGVLSDGPADDSRAARATLIESPEKSVVSLEPNERTGANRLRRRGRASAKHSAEPVDLGPVSRTAPAEFRQIGDALPQGSGLGDLADLSQSNYANAVHAA
jgi:hypothetical protein